MDINSILDRWATGRSNDINKLLARYPRVKLDGQAIKMLEEAEPERAEEILEEIQNCPEKIRNASHFVWKAVRSSPFTRGAPPVRAPPSRYQGERGPPAISPPTPHSTGPTPNPSGVAAIPFNISSKRKTDSSVRERSQPTRATSYPGKQSCADQVNEYWNNDGNYGTSKRELEEKHREYSKKNSYFNQLLARYSDLDLDDYAISKLQDADYDRAEEILEEVRSKGYEIRNPSSFVAKAVKAHPSKRGTHKNKNDKTWSNNEASNDWNWESYIIEKVLAKYPEIELDDKARSALEDADYDRAEEILEEIRSKGYSVRNPSAFICKAIRAFPQKRGGAMPEEHQAPKEKRKRSKEKENGAPPPRSAPPPPPRDDLVRRLLARYPSIELDDYAIFKLEKAHPDRIEEILQEVHMKLMKGEEIRNVPGFVCKAVKAFPEKRGTVEENRDDPRNSEKTLERASYIVREALRQNPDIANALDEGCKRKLMEADADRAVEVIEDVAEKGDVKNPSAFIYQALRKFPHKRAFKGSEGTATPTPSNRFLDKILAEHPRTASKIDERALELLRQCDPDRAKEIIQDVVAKRDDVKNVSAFVAKAVYVSKTLRDGGTKTDWKKIEILLARHPRIARSLDPTAMAKLKECDADRSLEIIRDLTSKEDVKNPSAFVTNALTKFPVKREMKVSKEKKSKDKEHDKEKKPKAKDKKDKKDKSENDAAEKTEETPRRRKEKGLAGVPTETPPKAKIKKAGTGKSNSRSAKKSSSKVIQAPGESDGQGILWRCAVFKLCAALESLDLEEPDASMDGTEALRQGVRNRTQGVKKLLLKGDISDELVDLCVSDEVLATVFAELGLGKKDAGAPRSSAARADVSRRIAGQLETHASSKESSAGEAHEAFGVLCEFVLLLGCTMEKQMEEEAKEEANAEAKEMEELVEEFKKFPEENQKETKGSLLDWLSMEPEEKTMATVEESMAKRLDGQVDDMEDLPLEEDSESSISRSDSESGSDSELIYDNDQYKDLDNDDSPKYLSTLDLERMAEEEEQKTRAKDAQKVEGSTEENSWEMIEKDALEMMEQEVVEKTAEKAKESQVETWMQEKDEKQYVGEKAKEWIEEKPKAWIEDKIHTDSPVVEMKTENGFESVEHKREETNGFGSVEEKREERIEQKRKNKMEKRVVEKRVESLEEKVADNVLMQVH